MTTRPPVDPQVIRAQQDEDWAKNPTVTRLGTENAIRREKTSAHAIGNKFDGLPGTSARSAKGIANIRERLNALRTRETKSGSDHRSKFSTVIESARTAAEPFEAKSTISVAATPSDAATFDAKFKPVAEKCGVSWTLKRYDEEHPVESVAEVIIPVKDDAKPEDVEAFKALLEKHEVIRSKINEMLGKEQRVRLWWGLEEAEGGKQVAVFRFFGYHERTDLPRALAKSMFRRGPNPLEHVADLTEGIAVKIESGDDLTETMVSRDTIAKALGNLRITARGEFSSEFAAKWLKPMFPSAMGLGRGQREFMQMTAPILPLLGVHDIDAHLTVDSPEHLLMNLIRQMVFLNRAKNGDPLPGSTYVEEKTAASATIKGVPLGVTGLSLWNVTHYMMTKEVMRGKDEILVTPLLHAAAKVLGPVSDISYDGKVLSFSAKVEGIHPLLHEFHSLKEQVAYFQAHADAAWNKPDMDANPYFNTREVRGCSNAPSPYPTEDGETPDHLKPAEDGADKEEESDEDDSSEAPTDPFAALVFNYKNTEIKEARAAGKDVLPSGRYGSAKAQFQEGNGSFLFNRNTHRLVPGQHDLVSYKQKVSRRNAALMVGVKTDNLVYAKELFRAWSTEHRLDRDVFEEKETESANLQSELGGFDEAQYYAYMSGVGLNQNAPENILGRYTTPEGRTVLFCTVPKDCKDTPSEATTAFACDAFVALEQTNNADGVEKQNAWLEGQFITDKSKIPRHLQYTWLHDKPCDAFHITHGEAAEAAAAEGGPVKYTKTFAVKTSPENKNAIFVDDDKKVGLEDLLKIRDEVIESAKAQHPSSEPSNGWDHPFTHLLTLGKAVARARKARKAGKKKDAEPEDAKE